MLSYIQFKIEMIEGDFMKKVIITDNAPAAIGPYVQATQSGNLIFVSGQLPLDPSTMEIVPGGIVEQTKQSLDNIKAILEAAGSSLNNVLKMTIFLQDLSQFTDVNEIYGTYFVNPYPARITCQVAKLPKGALIEIDAIAEV
jgi:2-iminobutanoate/2-iminopropanoate deaminase